MALQLMIVSSGYTLLNRSPFHPPSHVSRLEICSCHFLLWLFTIFSCHNTSPGQWMDVHSSKPAAQMREVEEEKSKVSLKPFLKCEPYLSLSLSRLLFLSQGHGVLCLSFIFQPKEGMKPAYWLSSTPEHHGHICEFSLQVQSKIA